MPGVHWANWESHQRAGGSAQAVTPRCGPHRGQDVWGREQGAGSSWESRAHGTVCEGTLLPAAPLPAPPPSPSSPRLAGRARWVDELRVWGGPGWGRRAVGCGYGVSSKHRWVSGCASSGYGVHGGGFKVRGAQWEWVQVCNKHCLSESLGRWGAGYKVQGLGCRMQGTVCRVWDAGCGVQGVRCRMQGTEFGEHNAGCRVEGAGSGVQSAGFGKQSAGCRIWGAGRWPGTVQCCREVHADAGPCVPRADIPAAPTYAQQPPHTPASPLRLAAPRGRG